MKKSRELIHLEHFKSVCPFFPDGDIEPLENDQEPPDFIVHSPPKHLGIEHTEIFQPGPSHGGSQQAQDSLAQKVVDKVNQLYLQNHSQSLLVQVTFKPRTKISKQDISRIADMINNLVEETLIEPGSPITLKRTRENSERFPKEVAMMTIFGQSNGNENRWCCSSAGFISEITVEQLQKIIDNKESKLDNYKFKCSEIWLLIVSDNIRIPSSVDLSLSSTTHHYNTRFNRMFFFWNSSRKYIELNVSSSTK